MEAAKSISVSEFMAKVRPAGKCSQLEDHREAILKLKNARYSVEQIRQWLAGNGIEVSGGAVRNFIASRTKTQ